MIIIKGLQKSQTEKMIVMIFFDIFAIVPALYTETARCVPRAM